jgi:hypothetical protein
MKIDFNNVRRKSVVNLNRLIKKLNDSVGEGLPPYADRANYICIEASELEDIINDLSNNIVSIACSYLEGEESCKDMSDHIEEIKEFNPKEE